MTAITYQKTRLTKGYMSLNWPMTVADASVNVLDDVLFVVSWAGVI